MNKLKNSLNIVFVAAALAFVPFHSATSAELWQAYTFLPSPVNPEVQRLEAAAKEIGKATNGALRIRVTPGGGLPIKGDDIQQAIADDVIQYGQVDGPLVSFLPIYGLSRLPGLYSNIEEFRKATDILIPYYKKHLEEKGLMYLGIFTYPGLTLFTRSHDFKDMSDLKGMKVRTTSPQQAIAVQTFGGVPVTIATAEVSAALQQGRIDAVATANAGGGRLWIDMLGVNYRIVISWSSGVILANKKRFDSLPEDTREKVAAISQKMAEDISHDLLSQEDQLIAQFAKEKGVKYIEPKPEEVKKLTQRSAAVWEAEAKKAGPDGVKALGEIRKALGK